MILIVDYDIIKLRILENIISSNLKYETLIATSVNDAVGFIIKDNSKAIELMIVDLRVGITDVLQAIKAIKSHRPDFPIIIITEYAEHDIATQAINAGANDFVTKPFVAERLNLSISNVLRIANLHKTIKILEQKLLADSVKPNSMSSTQHDDYSLFEYSGKVKNLANIEGDAIRIALYSCGGTMSKAARMLGISRSTLYRKVEELRIKN